MGSSITWHSSQSRAEEAQLVASPLGGKRKNGAFIQHSRSSGTSLKEVVIVLLDARQVWGTTYFGYLRVAENKRELSGLKQLQKTCSIADRHEMEQLSW